MHQSEPHLEGRTPSFGHFHGGHGHIFEWQHFGPSLIRPVTRPMTPNLSWVLESVTSWLWPQEAPISKNLSVRMMPFTQLREDGGRNRHEHIGK